LVLTFGRLSVKSKASGVKAVKARGTPHVKAFPDPEAIEILGRPTPALPSSRKQNYFLQNLTDNFFFSTFFLAPCTEGNTRVFSHLLMNELFSLVSLV